MFVPPSHCAYIRHRLLTLPLNSVCMNYMVCLHCLHTVLVLTSWGVYTGIMFVLTLWYDGITFTSCYLHGILHLPSHYLQPSFTLSSYTNLSHSVRITFIQLVQAFITPSHHLHTVFLDTHTHTHTCLFCSIHWNIWLSFHFRFWLLMISNI